MCAYTLCRVRNLEELSDKWDVSTKSLRKWLRELCGRGRTKIISARRDGKHDILYTLGLMHIWTHKDFRNIPRICINLSHVESHCWEWEMETSLHHYPEAISSWQLLTEEKLVFSKMVLPCTQTTLEARFPAVDGKHKINSTMFYEMFSFVFHWACFTCTCLLRTCYGFQFCVFYSFCMYVLAYVCVYVLHAFSWFLFCFWFSVCFVLLWFVL